MYFNLLGFKTIIIKSRFNDYHQVTANRTTKGLKPKETEWDSKCQATQLVSYS